MTRKNDLTALLPFPKAATRRDVRNPTRTGTRRNRTSRAATSRGEPVQLDQLDLADLVRHHATRRAALRGATLEAARGAALEARAPEGRLDPPRDSRWLGSDDPRRQVREATVEANSVGSTGGAADRLADGPCAGAVRRENLNFYLDLLGAVAVMALVLLAAILA